MSHWPSNTELPYVGWASGRFDHIRAPRRFWKQLRLAGKRRVTSSRLGVHGWPINAGREGSPFFPQENPRTIFLSARLCEKQTVI